MGYLEDQALLRKRIEQASKSKPVHPEQLPTPKRDQDPLIRRVSSWFSAFLLALTLMVCAGCATVCWLAQSNALTAFLGYLPIHLFFLPLPFAALLALPWSPWRSIAIFCIAILGAAWVGGWSSHDSQSHKPQLGELRLLSWNRGQGRHTSLRSLIAQTQPDVILLQDAKLSHYATRGEYGDYPWIEGHGEFVTLSRWPILSLKPLQPELRAGLKTTQQAWGLSMELDFNGRRIEVVSVHAPSPRGHLFSLLRGSAAWGVLGLLPVTDWRLRKAALETYWDPYFEFFSRLSSDRINSTKPVVVAGDFNCPAFGPIYRSLSTIWRDCHQIAGSGFGHTFPGNANHPLTLFQPWLRLDAAHVSAQWEVLRCRTLATDAQHLPLCVDLRLPARPHQP
jgi:endonuclease/exonuclease/phosphatase (EEP) superfamily protein YafD